jgi:hypothetical protein
VRKLRTLGKMVLAAQFSVPELFLEPHEKNVASVAFFTKSMEVVAQAADSVVASLQKILGKA